MRYLSALVIILSSSLILWYVTTEPKFIPVPKPKPIINEEPTTDEEFMAEALPGVDKRHMGTPAWNDAVMAKAELQFHVAFCKECSKPPEGASPTMCPKGVELLSEYMRKIQPLIEEKKKPTF